MPTEVVYFNLYTICKNRSYPGVVEINVRPKCRVGTLMRRGGIRSFTQFHNRFDSSDLILVSISNCALILVVCLVLSRVSDEYDLESDPINVIFCHEINFVNL